MLLDLFSTIVGALIAIFAVALLSTIWTRTAKPKKEAEEPCPFKYGPSCKTYCERWSECNKEWGKV